MKLRCPWLQAWEEWKIGEKARVAWDFSWFLISHTHFCEDIQLSDTLFCLPYTVGYFLGLMGCVGEAGAFVACVFVCRHRSGGNGKPPARGSSSEEA